MSNKKATIESSERKTIPQKENKRRLIFALKLIFFLAIVFIQIQYPEITEDYGISSNIIDATLFYITAHMLISFVRLFIVHLYLRRAGRQIDYLDNFILGINQIAGILSFIMFIFALFLIFNIDAGNFFTSISLVAVAIAVISKDYIANVINGMIIIFTDQLSLNDYVRIGNHQGKISNITLLNLQIINDDDDLVYLPNTSILTSDVVNYTKQNIKKITIDFELNQTYLKSYHQLKSDLNQVLEPYLKHIKENSQALKIVKINKDAVHFKFQFILIKRNRRLENEIKKEVLENVIYLVGKQEKNTTEF
ncbi:hypothetical protein BH23BAC1_BH23BAC1_19420 [soil metagenome]